MANQWRPEEWQNPEQEDYDRFAATDSLDGNGNETKNCYNAFEAGADAMMEVLKIDPVPISVVADITRCGLERGHINIFETIRHGEVTYKGQKGTLVFIPDGEPVSKTTKIRLTRNDVHSDCLVNRCKICDNDFPDYGISDICEDCEDKMETEGK